MTAVALVRCACGSTQLELRPGQVVPRLLCPRCPLAREEGPADPPFVISLPARPVLRLVQS